jgi:hypothetical protein
VYRSHPADDAGGDQHPGHRLARSSAPPPPANWTGRKLLHLLDATMLVLMDRGFDGGEFLAEVATAKAPFLVRLRSVRRPPVLRHLPDRSFISLIGGVKVRIIEMSGAVAELGSEQACPPDAGLTSDAGPRCCCTASRSGNFATARPWRLPAVTLPPTEVYRCAKTLLDHSAYPAPALIALTMSAGSTRSPAWRCGRPCQTALLGGVVPSPHSMLSRRKRAMSCETEVRAARPGSVPPAGPPREGTG